MVLQLPLSFPGSCKYPQIYSLDYQAVVGYTRLELFLLSISALFRIKWIFLHFPRGKMHTTDRSGQITVGLQILQMITEYKEK